MNTHATAPDRSGCTADRHGTVLAYIGYRCRCPDAREAARLYRHGLRHGLHTPPTTHSAGTARRLRALAAIGWPGDILATRLDCTWSWISQLQREVNPRVLLTTARRVADLYDELADTPGPSQRARQHAARADWDGPDAWWYADIDNPHTQPDRLQPDPDDIDHVVVDRLVHGEMRPDHATPAERRAAAHALAARGACPTHIGRHVGMSNHTVNRLLAA